MSTAPEDLAVSEGLQELADQVSDLIEALAGKRMGFSLLVFNTDPGSRMNYVSNCKREEVVNAMRSLLHGWEQGMPDIPAHKLS